MKSIVNLLKLNQNWRQFTFLIIFLQFLITISSISLTQLINLSIKAIQQKNMDILYEYVMIACIITILIIVFTRINTIYFTKTLLNSTQSLQTNLINNLFTHEKNKMMELKSGDVITNITQNAINALQLSFDTLKLVIQGTLILVCSLAFMLFLNVYMTLAIILFSICIRILTTALNKQINKANQKIIALNKTSNSFIIQILNNFLLIRAYDQFGFFKKTFEHNETLICNTATNEFAWSNGTSEIIWVTKKLIPEIIIVFGLGSYLVYRGDIDYGVIVAFIFLSDIFGKGIISLTDGFIQMSKAVPNIEAVFEFLEHAEVREVQLTVPPINNVSIKFENVTFSYNERTILDNVSFTLNKGDKIMITGTNGQGKSTLLYLLLGLIKPNHGAIYIGNQNVSHMTPEELGKHYSYIPQKSHIFPCGLNENIGLSEQTVTNQYSHLIDLMNINSHISEDPELFSEGEKQRVCIARGLIKAESASIVLADEIFSNVDQDNKEKISRVINEKIKEKLVIMVCHDDSSLFEFTKNLILDNGKVTIQNLT